MKTLTIAVLFLIGCGAGLDVTDSQTAAPEEHPQPTLRTYAGEPFCPCERLGAVDGPASCTGVQSCGNDGTCRRFCAWVKEGGAL